MISYDVSMTYRGSLDKLVYHQIMMIKSGPSGTVLWYAPGTA